MLKEQILKKVGGIHLNVPKGGATRDNSCSLLYYTMATEPEPRGSGVPGAWSLGPGVARAWSTWSMVAGAWSLEHGVPGAWSLEHGVPEAWSLGPEVARA